MIECRLKELLDKLPENEQDSYRAHARNIGIGWQQFWKLLHNKGSRTSLKNLELIRNYLAEKTEDIEPGQVRFYLGKILDERGLTQTETATESGISYVTINRTANNMKQYVDHRVVDWLCEHLELNSLDELLDTGGLLVWRKGE